MKLYLKDNLKENKTELKGKKEKVSPENTSEYYWHQERILKGKQETGKKREKANPESLYNDLLELKMELATAKEETERIRKQYNDLFDLHTRFVLHLIKRRKFSH